MLVEHEEEIAARLQAKPVQEWGIPYERFQADQAALMSLFQFMIGNTDWDLQSCRNILVLQPMDNSKMVTVPFDFDFSGLVSAPYASPNSESGLRHVQDRYLMAKGMDQDAMLRAKDTILAAKPALMRWCGSVQMSAESSAYMQEYLDLFFTKLAGSTEIPGRMEVGKK